MIVENVMTNPVHTLYDTATLADARQQMESRRVRQLPVVNRQGELVGIVSHRDVLSASLSRLNENYERSKGVLEKMVPITDLMSTNVHTVSPQDKLSVVADALMERRVGAFPVLDGGKLVGIIGSSDFLGLAAFLLKEKEEQSGS